MKRLTSPFLIRQFIRTNPRSIDELWYKRAVDYYTSYHDSYVFSLELRNSDDLPTERLKVTATRAIFLKTNTTRMQDERRKVSSSIAPVAVVGFRMDHSGFAKEVEKHLDVSFFTHFQWGHDNW